MKQKLKRLIPDKLYLKLRFKKTMGYSLDLKNPKTFNEKIQWLKLFDRKPEYTMMVDKYAVKKYIAEKIGYEYIIPTLGVWESFDEIDFDLLPNQFVLKCIHDSGGLVVCHDKLSIDKDIIKKKIENSQSYNFYYSGREWPYKNVPSRIIAEQYMADNLRNYKQLGFDSKPRMVLIYSEIFIKDRLKQYFYDEAWNHRVTKRPENGSPIITTERLSQYKVMRKLTEYLAKKISFSRIDFYEINEKNYFAEIELDPVRGFKSFKPEEWKLQFGEWIKLSEQAYKFIYDDCSIIISSSYYKNKQIKALVDYKFFCFDGVAESVMVCTEREKGNPKFYFFDKQWNLRKYNILGRETPEGFTLQKPNCIDEMFSIAEKLSKGIPFVRVDLYCIDNLVYFGEMTFYPDSGFDTNLLKESDEYWGEMLKLPEKRRK